MKNVKLISKALMATALCTGALMVGNSEAQPPQCPRLGVICTQEYRPVICNDGVVYPNSCYAYIECAKGCKEYNEVAP